MIQSRKLVKKMKIFILEDDPRRMVYFRKEFENYGHSITWKETADEAIEHLKNHYDEYSNIFLDHDLGGQVYVDSNEHNTGHTVAKWIAENTNGPYDHIVIHSMNIPAAERMRMLLEDSNAVPFHMLFNRITFYGEKNE